MRRSGQVRGDHVGVGVATVIAPAAVGSAGLVESALLAWVGSLWCCCAGGSPGGGGGVGGAGRARGGAARRRKLRPVVAKVGPVASPNSGS